MKKSNSGGKLNLGCGPKWKEQYPDYLGIDIIDYGQVYQGDVAGVLSCLSEFLYDEVMANHFLEHFDQEQLKVIFKEVYRILRVGGIFRFVVPHMDKERSWILSHKTFWNEDTCNWLGEEDVDKVYGFGRWRVKEVITNGRMDIHVVLVKKL